MAIYNYIYNILQKKRRPTDPNSSRLPEGEGGGGGLCPHAHTHINIKQN